MVADLPVLNRRFTSLEQYKRRAGESYTLLPFRFLSLDLDRYILTNLVGEHVVLPGADLAPLIRKQLPVHSAVYNELKAKHFLMDGESSIALELLAAKYRTKRAPLATFTALHLFVVRIRQ